jgi:hypothetical protein
MSTRLGMGADRCFRVYESSRIYNDIVMQKHGIHVEDNHAYRKYLQETGPEAFFVPADAACRPPAFSSQANTN